MKPSRIYKILFENRGFQLTVFLLWCLAVFYFIHPIVNRHKFVTLHKTLKSGEITVITQNTPHCYYIYRGQPMGFEYELAEAFAQYLGVTLKVNVMDDWDGMIAALQNGSGAFIAAGATITLNRSGVVAFSDSFLDIQQHIITNRKKTRIKSLEDLTGQTIHVVKGSPHHQRLMALRKTNLDFHIEPHEGVPSEELIQMTSEGRIDVTVADSNILILNRRHYPGAVMKKPISGKMGMGWAVNLKSHQLLSKINQFFETVKENGRFDEIFEKYYGGIEEYDYVDLRFFHRRIKERLSRYSPFIKEAARKHGFDWRLIAAQIYQESHLNPRAKSHAGARGLMQLLPSTARSLGVTDIFDPLQNINAGVRHLKYLYDRFNEADEQDRMLLSLAAYNIGEGHISDARQIAVGMGLDPNQWSSLAKTLPMLSQRKYYKKSKFGYCRGREPIRYIKRIMMYYDILKRQGIEYGSAQAMYQ